MKVQAWKTPDGKLFEDETKYLKHVKKCKDGRLCDECND